MCYEVTDVTEKPCPLCIDGKSRGKEVFDVKGPYSGLCCAAHLAILIRQQSPKSEVLSANGVQ